MQVHFIRRYVGLAFLTAWAACLASANSAEPLANSAEPPAKATMPLTNEQLDAKYPASRWEKNIAAFEAADKEQMPPVNGIVFVGSSSIVRWPLDESFPNLPVIQRGFGGSQLSDSVHFADRIVIPYRPATVVIYAGDNDLGSGKTPQRVLSDYQKFVAKVHKALPETRILYIAVKPSIKRWSLVDKVKETNALIEQAAAKNPRLGYIDIFTPMLGTDGQPREELFVKDGLHLSDKGYALWNKVVGDAIAAAQASN